MDKLIRTNFQLPITLWEKAKKKALKQHVSLAEFIRQAIEFYLSK